jgi:hypothetical protein
MACCSPEKLDPRAVDKDMANACCAQPHTPNYVGKVAYIMGPGSYAGGNNSGLFVIIAQDGDRRIDAVPLMVGYDGYQIKRFNLQREVETLDSGKEKVTEPSVLTQVREDTEFVLDWARRQYRWGVTKAPGRDGKQQWADGVYTGASAIAELVVITLERITAEREKLFRDLQRSYQQQLDRAVKDAMYRVNYGG